MAIFITSKSSSGGTPIAVSVPNVTDWALYTPTFSGFGTVTNIEFAWRQVGDSYEIRGKWLTGSPTAVEAQITLPNGATTASTSKIPSTVICGQVAKGGASDNYSGLPVLIQPSVTYLNFGGNYSGGTSSGQSTITIMLGSVIFNASETDELFCTVPIAGLSANTVYNLLS